MRLKKMNTNLQALMIETFFFMGPCPFLLESLLLPSFHMSIFPPYFSYNKKFSSLLKKKKKKKKKKVHFSASLHVQKVLVGLNLKAQDIIRSSKSMTTPA